MSRLIDADALFRQVSKNLGTSTMYLPIDFQEEIMDAPTIDAIPVAWLCDYSGDHYDATGHEVTVLEALRYWKKENE